MEEGLILGGIDAYVRLTRLSKRKDSFLRDRGVYLMKWRMKSW